jgi:HD-like signal output (HDOD) protein
MTNSNQSTASTPLQKLLNRMDSSNGFPALSSTVAEINRIVENDLGHNHSLTNAILHDVSLTHKVLQLVNTVNFSQYGGRINTISKAVIILGQNTVRNLATSLILLEFMQNKAQAQEIKNDIVIAFFAGVVAKSLCKQNQLADAEEGMICGMFQNLGRLLTVFFFYAESQRIHALITAGTSEHKAVTEVLGVGYQDIGNAVAKKWCFPERLIQGMKKYSLQKHKTAQSELERLSAISSLGNELCMMALTTSDKDRVSSLDGLVDRYKDATQLNSEALNQALKEGLSEIEQCSSILNISLAKSPVLQTISIWTGLAEASSRKENENDHLLEGIQELEAEITEQAMKQTPEDILNEGVQDITNTLINDFALNDLLQMVVETMYRGLNFNRTMMFIRDPKKNTMSPKFGFGQDTDHLLNSLNFSLDVTPDVFHVAVDKGVDIVIEDVSAENIANKIPAWFHQKVKAKSFLLLPMMVKNKTIGLIYADSETANGLKIKPQQLTLLRILRNQAVLGFKQKL